MTVDFLSTILFHRWKTEYFLLFSNFEQERRKRNSRNQRSYFRQHFSFKKSKDRFRSYFIVYARKICVTEETLLTRNVFVTGGTLYTRKRYIAEETLYARNFSITEETLCDIIVTADNLSLEELFSQLNKTWQRILLL